MSQSRTAGCDAAAQARRARRPAARAARCPLTWHTSCLVSPHPFRSRLMRAWWIPALVLLAACTTTTTATGRASPPRRRRASPAPRSTAPSRWCGRTIRSRPIPTSSGTTGSTAPPTTSTRTPAARTGCVEGTTVAPEFLVGALANGVPRCFSVTAVSVDGLESDRSPLRGDTPRPDSRNVALSAAPTTPNGSGFRFWDDLNDDGSTQSGRAGPGPKRRTLRTSTSSWTGTGTAISS